MAQNKIKINGVEIWQPDEELDWNYETTYTEDSGNTQDGVGHITPMFTKESFKYVAKFIPASKATEILKMIVGKQFNLYAYNPYFNKWMTMRCYVGKGSLKIKTVKNNDETMKSLSFNMVDLVPLEKQK